MECLFLEKEIVVYVNLV